MKSFRQFVEEYNELDELSPALLRRYDRKAGKDLKDKHDKEMAAIRHRTDNNIPDPPRVKSTKPRPRRDRPAYRELAKDKLHDKTGKPGPNRREYGSINRR